MPVVCSHTALKPQLHFPTVWHEGMPAMLVGHMTSSSPSSSASASPYRYDILCFHLRITGKKKKKGQDRTTKPATISTDRPTNRLKLVDRACVVHGGYECTYSSRQKVSKNRGREFVVWASNRLLTDVLPYIPLIPVFRVLLSC